MDAEYEALLRTCASRTTCQSCTRDRHCGFFYNTGVCVPGGWLAPHSNYTDSGSAWSYYHGHCLISTRTEFVLLPSICGLLILLLAIVALWQSWPAYWCGFGLPGPTTPHASPVLRSTSNGESYDNAPDEHMPLLIDNDPGSRQQAVNEPPSHATESSAIPHIRHQDSGGGGAAQTGTSFEEQYGSWCQRSQHMVQGGTDHGN